MTNELELYIKSYFGIVQQSDLQKISNLFTLTSYKKGDYFLKTGSQSNEMSFVQTGLLRVYAITNKKEVTQWISTKGFFITDLSSFVFETPTNWNIQALVDTELYTISRKNYNKIATLIPEWTHLEKLFIVSCFKMMEDRIFRHLSMTAEERYTWFFENNKELFNLVPLQYIASLLGMTPETFSRIRKKQLL